LCILVLERYYTTFCAYVVVNSLLKQHSVGKILLSPNKISKYHQNELT